MWGGQKLDQQGFREQRPVGWDGGPKRETRGAIGDPGVKIGGATSQEMPELGLGEEQMWGLYPLCRVTSLPFSRPRFQFSPTLTP